MKLRHDKGKPLIVLEAGDVSAIEKVLGLLTSAASILDGTASAESLDNLADGLSTLAMDRMPGIVLPKKRKAASEAGGVFAPDGPLVNDRQLKQAAL